MRPIFFIIIISLFLLTACGAAAPQVTVTSEVTVTLTPAATLTATPTATFTPAPAFSPEADGIIADEATPEEVRAFLTDAKEGGLAATVKDNMVKIEGDLFVDPITGKAERTYPFTLPDGKVIQLTTSGQVGVDVTIGMDANGNAVVTTPAWKYTKEVGWVREQGIFYDRDGVETTKEIRSLDEIKFAIASDHSTDSVDAEETVANLRKIVEVFTSENRSNLNYDGVFESLYHHYYWGENSIIIRDSNGEVVEEVSTSLYCVYPFGENGEYAFVMWRAADKAYNWEFVHKLGLDIPTNWDPSYPAKW